MTVSLKAKWPSEAVCLLLLGCLQGAMLLLKATEGKMQTPCWKCCGLLVVQCFDTCDKLDVWGVPGATDKQGEGQRETG